MASLTLPSTFSQSFTRARDYWLRGLPWVGKGSLAVLDQGLISGSNFLIGILLARWLAPEQYGAYTLAFSLFLFASGFHSALLLEPMSVFGPASYGECLGVYLGRLIGLNLALAAVLTALVGACIPFQRYLTLDRTFSSALWAACLATPFILLFWLCRRAAYIKLAPGLATRASSAYCFVVFSLLLLTQRFHWLSSFTAFLIQAVAATAAVILLLASLRPQLGSRSGPSSVAIVSQHWRYGRWGVATQFVYWLSGNAYYVLVAAFLRMQDVAALRALQNFTLPFVQFLNAISLLVLPWASARFAEKGRAGFQRQLRHINLLFVGLASAYYATLWLFGGRIIGVLYAGRYTEFAHLLPLVAAPAVVLAASQASGIALQAMQFPADLFLAYTLASVATIVAGVPLTRYWGLPGAASGMLISYLTVFAVMSYQCRARLGKPSAMGAEAPL